MSRAAYASTTPALGRADGRVEADGHDGRRADRPVRHGPHGRHRRERRGEVRPRRASVQDAFAVESHKRAAAAIAAGHFKSQILPIELKSKKGPVVFDTDEHVRGDASLEGMAKLKAVFIKENGTVTAGNASGINDAAAAVVLMEKSVAAKKGLKPMARLVAYGHAGIDPKIMGLGPVTAVKRALAKAGLKVSRHGRHRVERGVRGAGARRIEGAGHGPEEGQPERRRHRARSPDRRHRRDPHGQGDVRAAAHRRPLRRSSRCASAAARASRRSSSGSRDCASR